MKSQVRSPLTADSINVLATTIYSSTKAGVLQREMVFRMAIVMSKRLAEVVARVVGIWRRCKLVRSLAVDDYATHNVDGITSHSRAVYDARNVSVLYTSK